MDSLSSHRSRMARPAFISQEATSLPGQNFLAEERRTASIAKDLVFIATPLLATVVAAAVVLSGRAAGFSTKIGTGGYDIVSGVLVSCILISGLVFGLKRHPEQLARVVVACITFAGTT